MERRFRSKLVQENFFFFFWKWISQESNHSLLLSPVPSGKTFPKAIHYHPGRFTTNPLPGYINSSVGVHLFLDSVLQLSKKWSNNQSTKGRRLESFYKTFFFCHSKIKKQTISANNFPLTLILVCICLNTSLKLKPFILFSTMFKEYHNPRQRSTK